MKRRLYLVLASVAAATLLSGCPTSSKVPTPTPTPTPDVPVEPTPAPASEPGAGKSIQDVGPAAPTLFILSGLKGYTEPCGCTLDILLGGIDRISGYVDAHKKLARGSAVIDAGNTLFDTAQLEAYRVPQEKAKVEVIVQGMSALGVQYTTPGPNDFALGRDFYTDTVGTAGIEVLAANLNAKGAAPLGPGHAFVDLEGTKVGLIGLVQEDLFVGLEGLEVTPLVAAARRELTAVKAGEPAAIVAVVHGDLKTVKELLREVPEIDFAVVGHNPRMTDQVDPVGDSWTVEAYDQGRYVGVLKLYPGATRYQNARKVSKADIDRVDRRIEQIEGQLDRMPPAKAGEEPAFVVKLRGQLAEARAEKERVKNAGLSFPDKGTSAFVYRSVAMEPGYPENPELTKAKDAFNAKLEALVSASPEPIAPVPEGQAGYVGNARCGTCHPTQMEFWKKTRHAAAINTLVKRNKSFDNNCVGCHVTGYRKPGGSVLGNFNSLENVGCEQCHGPGSDHVVAGAKEKIALEAPATVCVECHNDEHSPRFNYDTYRKSILGEGHGAR
jgi:hypothetical protein